MAMKLSNPLVWMSEKINSALDTELEPTQKTDTITRSVAPTTTQAPVEASSSQETQVVAGRFVENGQNGQEITLTTQAAEQTERFARIVEQFDEDKQEPIEWAIRKAATFFAYFAPFVLSIPIGLTVGDAFTPVGATGAMPFTVHLLSCFLEILMPILGLASVISFKRAMKERSKMAGAISVALFFLVVSIINSLALLVILEQGTKITSNAILAAVLGRSFGALLIDVGCSVYLAVSSVKSLAKYLADQRAKEIAIKEVNDVHIAVEQTQIKAAIDRQTAIMDMQSKQSRANTWNEIEKMQSQAMIEQARKNMSGGDGSNYRRSGW